MNWKEYIEKLPSAYAGESFSFFEPALSQDISWLKKELDVTAIPPELEEFWMQTNGGYRLFDDGTVNMWLIFSIEQSIEANNQYRKNNEENPGLYLPIDDFLFFSPDGFGNPFGFKLDKGRFQSSDVYVWTPIEDERILVASSLKDFLLKWNTGQLKY